MEVFCKRMERMTLFMLKLSPRCASFEDMMVFYRILRETNPREISMSSLVVSIGCISICCAKCVDSMFWFASVHLRISHWSSKSGKQSDVAVAARRWSPWVVNHVRRPFRFHLNWQLIWILMWSVKRLVVPSLPLVIAFSTHLAQASDDSFAIWHVAVFHISIWCVLHLKLGRPVMLFSNFPFH